MLKSFASDTFDFCPRVRTIMGSLSDDRRHCMPVKDSDSSHIMQSRHMTRTGLEASKIMIILISLSLWPGHARSGNQAVITDDGREVLLNEDGSWEFRSTDRFATTEDGLRIRLKEDGSWQYVGNAPLTSKEEVRTTELDIKLQKVVIERHEKKVKKNKRVKTQTVFYLDLGLSSLAKRDISITKNDVSLIRVTDNEGKSYPVLSIQPSPAVLTPGSDTAFTIRVDGSPKWWKNIKSLDIVFTPGIFGIQAPVTFSRSVDDMDKKDVDGFENTE